MQELKGEFLIHSGMTHDLGGGFVVRRLLPWQSKRMVGPFIFLDHFGPVVIESGQNTDVRPHPHIGLSTLTYLFDGRIVHRDSLGYSQAIEPGGVNWMTAGKGIAHSERAHPQDRGVARRMHGLQFWVALPDEKEEDAPSFSHYASDSIPEHRTSEFIARVVAGTAFGRTSPVQVSSPLLFVDVEAQRDARIELGSTPPEFELAIYVIRGSLLCESQAVTTGQLAVLPAGLAPRIGAPAGTHFIVIGGTPFATRRFIWWNLVSSTSARIESAKQAWRDGSFPQVAGDDERIELPNTPGP